MLLCNDLLLILYGIPLGLEIIFICNLWLLLWRWLYLNALFIERSRLLFVVYDWIVY